MKRFALVLILLALVGVSRLGPEAWGQESRPAKPAGPSAKSLAFLAGDWESRSAEESFRAHYSDPEGGMVLGVSKSVEKGRAQFFELEVFGVQGGELVLQPYPGGKAAAAFALKESTRTSVTFANPKNPFPSEITYACPAKDRLEITLRGQGREQRFVLKRLALGAPR